MPEIVIARDCPAQVQHVILAVVPNARFVVVGTGCAIAQRAGTGIAPQGFERLLDVFEFDLRSQRQVAMDMDLKGGVVATHVPIMPITEIAATDVGTLVQLLHQEYAVGAQDRLADGWGHL